MSKLRYLFTFVLIFSAASAFFAAQGFSNGWQTLRGDAPLVIAHGGFSGIFPSSTYNAYTFALTVSLSNTVLWCDVQLTKDGVGICFPDLRLENGSLINNIQKDAQKTRLVNGVQTSGWFSIDYTFDELRTIPLKQGIHSRTFRFDGTPHRFLTVEEVATTFKPPAFWLNVQNDAFFSQYNLSMKNFITSASKSIGINYISSPEVNFLKSIGASFNTNATKLVFRFLGPSDVEPSTKQTYGSFLKNLKLIKTFASAILVPKSYIWPLDSNQYLLPSTTLVVDAHKEGLEVYASGFSNDVDLAYNFSYDPQAESLKFIDNGIFSVDGLLTDFPITSSMAIDCFSRLGKNEPVQAKVTVISKEGASGEFPGCTDLAYGKAISDGADIIDCPVQITRDGIPFCLGSINLVERTTASQLFKNVAVTIPELNVQNGICAFNLTWSQIQSLQPSMYDPYLNYKLHRNPAYRNSGKLVQLSDFLALAKSSPSVSGVLISIENAAFLAKNGLGVVDAVLDTLSKSGYSQQTSKKVMIASKDSPVLIEVGKKSNYERIYNIGEEIHDITDSTILEIKKFASSVILLKKSVFPIRNAFLTGLTDTVPKLQAEGVAVYVETFSNEFVSQAWDYFSDPYVEVNTHVSVMKINGTISDFPATTAKYRRNRCLGYKDVPPYMRAADPGSLFELIAQSLLPPAEPPLPTLTDGDVIEPPLPPVTGRSPPAPNSGNVPSRKFVLFNQ